jgi:hypothetical protein
MVLPEFQSGPIGYHVLKAAADALPISGGLAVAPAARRLFTALGYTDCGAIDNWLRPLRPARIMAQLDVTGLGLSRLSRWIPAFMRVARRTGVSTLVGWCAGSAFRVTAALMRGRSAEFETEVLDPSLNTSDLAALWQRCSSSFPCGVVRDPTYLIPRYPIESHEPYRWLGVRRARSLVGVAILKVPRDAADGRLGGIRVATLSDLLFDTRDIRSGFALLGAAERAASALNADAVLASSSAHPAVHILRRQLYLPLGGSVHLLFRGTSEAGPVFSHSVRDWWLHRGDGRADDAF